MYLVSAGGFGRGRRVTSFWKRLPNELELFFEMTNDTVPVVGMQLSPDGAFLYLLRQGERGIRGLDVGRLMSVFQNNDL